MGLAQARVVASGLEGGSGYEGLGTWGDAYFTNKYMIWSCVLQVGNLFGRHRSTIITLYNGAFDSSSAVFLIIKVKNSNSQHLWNTYMYRPDACLVNFV